MYVLPSYLRELQSRPARYVNVASETPLSRGITALTATINIRKVATMIGQAPNRSGNRRCGTRRPRNEEGKKESSVRPPTSRRNRFEPTARLSERSSSFVLLSYTRACGAARGFPWERRSRRAECVREEGNDERPRKSPRRLARGGPTVESVASRRCAPEHRTFSAGKRLLHRRQCGRRRCRVRRSV